MENPAFFWFKFAILFANDPFTMLPFLKRYARYRVKRPPM